MEGSASTQGDVGMHAFPDDYQQDQEGSNPYGSRNTNGGHAYYYQLHAQHPAFQSRQGSHYHQQPQQQQRYAQEQSYRIASGGSGSSLMFRDGFREEIYLDVEEDGYHGQDGPSGVHTPQSYQGPQTGSGFIHYSASHSLPAHNGAHAMGLGINMGSGHVQHQAAHYRYLQATANGPFLSPASTTEPFIRERCSSQHSNHSTLSAPPIMQHDMYYPHYVYQQRLQQAGGHGEPQGATGLSAGYPAGIKLEEAYSVPHSPQVSDEDLPESLSKPFSEAARGEEPTVVKIESPAAPSKLASCAVSTASMNETSPTSNASAKAENSFVSPASISPTLVSVQPAAMASGPNGLPPPAVAAALATFNRTSSNASMYSVGQASPASISSVYARQAQNAYYTMHYPQQQQQHSQTIYQVHPAYQYQQQAHAQHHAAQVQPYQFGSYGHPQAVSNVPQGQYTLWPTPPSSTQPQFTSQFGSEGSLTPASATAPRMYVTTSQPGMIHAPYGYESEQHRTQESVTLAHASGMHAANPAHLSPMQTSPSPPPYEQRASSATGILADPSQVKYLQAPALSRSISSPVMPQSAMSQPNTPMLAQTPTFATPSSLYTTLDDDATRKSSSHFLGITTAVDLVGEA
ncbi:hypothetical protein P389DRAFT_81146 [Cystobasidium minutum MCA 4210]|uniref:uncharacterized protein n=1 Tax=Cystobasidium minutum MCA 4210 TaxID=1397322 RepID=UPI0034CE028D|eukprot:jgi/Rhomi1/81146/CE81145_164